MSRLHALVVLAWALLRTLVARLFGRTRGLAAFHASYARDRLPATTASERTLLASVTGCIACGLCDIGPGMHRGAMDLALSSSRSTPDADAAARTLCEVTDESLARAEAICPGRVPLQAMAALTRERARAIAGPDAA